MTEIPEHLLKRSRERRAALGLPGDGGEAEPAAAAPEQEGGVTPVVAAPAAPAPVARTAAPAPAPAAPPPKPEPTYVQAAKSRVRIPIWAVGVLGLLPLWALLYVWSLTPNEEKVLGPLAVGAEVYASCSSCHGGQGQGGVGRPFTNGEVIKTFPEFESQASFVHTGSQPYADRVYGDPEREGGPRLGLSYNGAAMPAFPSLTAAELIGVVCHERYTLGGAEESGEEWDLWCSPEAENFVDAEGGATFEDLGIATEAAAG